MNVIEIQKEQNTKVAYPKGMVSSVSDKLLSQYVQYVWSKVKHRQGNTKNRGEVRGGGAKPWRQKGTGRARHGSSRSPIWVGGGVTFGPRKEHSVLTKRMNKKMRRSAYLSMLSEFVKEEKVMILKESIKPADLRKRLAKDVDGVNTVYLVANDIKNTTLKAIKNIEKASVISVNRFGANQMMGKSLIVFDAEAWQTMLDRYSK